MFDRLIHADWSVDSGKRWMASAARQGKMWHIKAPKLFGPASAFLDCVFTLCKHERILVGFDFPLGLPYAYGVRTDLHGFKEALSVFGEGEWQDSLRVANAPEEVCLRRPFYPNISKKGVTIATLVKGLGVRTFEELLRICDRRTENRKAACSVFWTLGGNQVGKAAITGWSEIISPAITRGARVWPFDGILAELSGTPGVVIAETYPAEAYHMIEANFQRNESKRRPADRKGKAHQILRWANKNGVSLSWEARCAVEDGFGSLRDGEDRFDAFVGLLKMIEVADERRPEASEQHPEVAQWEGWILGQ